MALAVSALAFAGWLYLQPDPYAGKDVCDCVVVSRP